MTTETITDHDEKFYKGLFEADTDTSVTFSKFIAIKGAARIVDKSQFKKVDIAIIAIGREDALQLAEDIKEHFMKAELTGTYETKIFGE